MIFVRPVSFSLFFIVSVLFHCASANDSSDPAATLFELSGLRTQMQQVSVAIGQGFDSAGLSEFTGTELSAESIQRIRAGMVSAFNPDRLSAIVRDTLSTELNSSDMHLAIEWHRSALGSKITGYEIARSHLTQAEDRDQFLQSLRGNPPSSERIAALKELNDAWNSTDTSVSMMIDMQVAVSAAMMSALPIDRRTSISALVEIYGAQREALTAHYDTETLWSMLYVYADLSTNEVAQYTEFALSPSGRRYVGAANLALHKAMLEGSYALGVELGVELGAELNKEVRQSELTTM